jgi:beta-glucosidase
MVAAMVGQPFPEGFLFGAGTSAFQVEGAIAEDGRGPSIWDDFTRRRGDHGDVACDQYHRIAEDVALMRELGLGAYRFSIAWPRILPRGRGAVNQRGLDYYARLVDALLAANITPLCTLYHWDLPSALGGDDGGWEERSTAQAFGEYAGVVARALGDRVPYFATLNEPAVVMFQGYISGQHPPGHKNVRGFLRSMGVLHHLLLGHGLAVQALRSEAPKAKVGITNALCQVYPATDSARDREAADTAQQLNHLFLQAIFHGVYHKALLNPVLQLGKRIKPGDLATIAQPIDFIGANVYTRARVKKVRLSVLGYEGIMPDPAQVECTDMGWEVAPAALYDLMMWLHREYPSARILITENGAAYRDVLVGGEVHDEARRRYLERHLREVRRAIADGCPIDAYFAWSLLDNFEWTHGYAKRFGLVYVDYPTQRRIIKDSGRWYAGVCRDRVV